MTSVVKRAFAFSILAMTIALLATPLDAQVRVRRAAGQQPASPPAEDKAPPISIKRPDAPQGAFQLVECVVMIIDPNRANANEMAMFKSTVPGFARGRRSAPSSLGDLKNPSPIGLIRLVGKENVDDGTIDVLLQLPGGKFLGSWPNGKSRGNRQLWEKIALKQGTTLTVPADAGHWFETLRGGDAKPASPLSTSRWSENFLMYDAEITYPNVLRVKAAENPAEGYRVANTGSSALRDLHVYAPVEGGGSWRVAGVAEVPATKTPPATKPSLIAALPEGPAVVPAGPATDALKQIFNEINSNVKPVDVKVEDHEHTEQPATASATKPATQPATKPSTQPAAGASASEPPKEAWRDAKIDAKSKPIPAAEAVADWGRRLKEAGLTTADANVIVATLQTHALDPEQMTVVYRMDAAELDRVLPLEVVPTPAKITRVGIAIVKNIDPATGERIAKLVEQLGNPNWEKREAAYTKLAEMGAGAKPKLNEALKHKDMEVVYRAERLLESINNP